jgi:hypothetical protein
MQLNDVVGDVFSVADDYFLAHAISRDYKMGAGIAVDFNKKFELRYQLSRENIKFPDCILVGRVFNLVDKEKYWQKPTYDSLENSLSLMKKIIIEKKIAKVAMPKIGCGLDKLAWKHVRRLIEKVFRDTEVQIDVFSSPPRAD